MIPDVLVRSSRHSFVHTSYYMKSLISSRLMVVSELTICHRAVWNLCSFQFVLPSSFFVLIVFIHNNDDIFILIFIAIVSEFLIIVFGDFVFIKILILITVILILSKA